MERATRVLNAASVVIVVLTGIYMMFAFDQMLTVTVRVAVAAVLVAYVLARLMPFRKARRTEPAGTGEELLA